MNGELAPGALELFIVSFPYRSITLIFILGVIVGIIILYIIYSKRFGSVDKKLESMVKEATKDANLIKKEAELEKKDIIIKAHSELDKEANKRKSELLSLEKRFVAKEELLEKKYISLEKKENDIRKREDKVQQRDKESNEYREEVKKLIERKKVELLNIARLSQEDAKQKILKMLDDELEAEKTQRIRMAESEAKFLADKKARNIIVLAIQRQAADQSQEHSTKVIPIPNDEMKGRIIGRDGRNIRAFEQACGVDMIVDDTPDSIVISSFDPIRKHIARVSLDKLLQDGRIHPARIEEVVAKTRKETGIAIRDAGESAVLELGLTSIHPELLKLIGQLQFRFSYGQEQLKHSMEVAKLAGIMAAEVGVNEKLAKRAGLLHDIGKAVTHEIEGSHAMIGADLCKKYDESADVEHAVRAHHRDIEPKTVLAFLVDAADAISGGRPGARSKTEANFVQRLEKLEEICTSYKGVQRSYAVQAGRDVRVMVDPDKINDEQAAVLVRDISKRIAEEIQFPGQIKVSVIREYRAVDYAQ